MLFRSGDIVEGIRPETRWPWVNELFEKYAGSFVGATVEVDGLKLNVLSSYVPAFRLMSRTEVAEQEGAEEVRLQHWPEVWGTELVWAAATHRASGAPWIIGGDMNSCETFDRTKPRGNREFQERMVAAGFTEALRHAQGGITPTFLNPRTKQVRNQIDHLFVENPLISSLLSCEVPDSQDFFDTGLSDHLPIIAEFDLGAIAEPSG